MTPIKRPLAAASAAVLLGLSLSACGGAPTDASVDEFCEVQKNEEGGEEFFKAVSDEDWDKVEELVQEQADKAEEVGTPEDIPDDAREGFEIQLDAIKDVSADDYKKAFKDDEDPFEDAVSGDDEKKVEAFEEYTDETCDDSGEGSTESEDPDDAASEVTEPSDLSSELPTELPSDLPSDFPTDPEELESLLSDLPTEVPSE